MNMIGATRLLLVVSSAPVPRLRLGLQRRSLVRCAQRHDLCAGASELVKNLSAAGYLEGMGCEGDQFLQAANACLAFARHRPDMIAKLPRRDIEVLLENAQHTATRITSFMSTQDHQALASDKAQMVDLMRFLLSYASNLIVPPEKNSLYNNELVEASVQNLFSELVKLSYSAPQRQENQFLDGYGQIPKPVGETIEMKRGDWICPRCTFMNFARNAECRECQESRPKRQLTGGEWTCPQCDYYNYGKNSVCLRCDCKRPGHVSFGHANSRSGLDYDKERRANNADVDSSRFAANEQKGQGWSSKVSQLDDTSNKNPTIVDEDFPDIMPLRKGVNRFVVSTRKTPLERRLADAQYCRNSGSDGSPDRNDLQRKSVNDKSVISGQRAGANSASIQYSPTEGSNYVPFVPLPADRFIKKVESPKMEGNEKAMMDNHRIINANSTEQSGALSGIKDLDRSGDSIQLSEKPVNQTDNKASDQEGTEKSERWYKRISELHDVEDLATAIPDEDFPEVMPIRKGENRFVVSNKKDRSLTSPMYKRRMAMEQTNNNNYVPFVPLPTDYFAKKNKPQIDGATSETPSLDMQNKAAERLNESRSSIINDDVDKVEKQPNTRSMNLVPSTENRTGTSVNPPTGISSCLSSGYQRKENANEITNPRTSTRPSENQNSRGGSTGKSLEGSAVKKPDPLDMSEEAKAERWFRRVAQIKDISELSQIPDEDFPSIMPMRKGVNRFVVSKRKTPLERRLTSPQYRKNLPIVSSDPTNNENEGS